MIDDEDRIIEAMPEIRKRVAHEMLAFDILGDYLGDPVQDEGQTLRVRLGDMIRKGEFYPFDADAETRLMKAITED